MDSMSDKDFIIFSYGKTNNTYFVKETCKSEKTMSYSMGKNDELLAGFEHDNLRFETGNVKK